MDLQRQNRSAPNCIKVSKVVRDTTQEATLFYGMGWVNERSEGLKPN